MLKIEIQGLKDGKHEIRIVQEAKAADGIFPEFYGEVAVDGVLTKLAQRLTFVGTVQCNALLTCDYSLKEYAEKIECNIKMSFVLNTALFLMRRDEPTDDGYEVIVLREDEKFIDISDEVAQELSVRLPLKRIAPEFRDKDLRYILRTEDIESADKHSSVDEQLLSVLKSIHFDN